jgi:hypothetical protein
MTILTDENRIARKPHRCEWCGERIEPGQQYRYYSGVFYGNFQSTHMHNECYDACQEDASEYGMDYEFEPYRNGRGKREVEE